MKSYLSAAVALSCLVSSHASFAQAFDEDIDLSTGQKLCDTLGQGETAIAVCAGESISNPTSSAVLKVSRVSACLWKDADRPTFVFYGDYQAQHADMGSELAYPLRARIAEGRTILGETNSVSETGSHIKLSQTTRLGDSATESIVFDKDAQTLEYKRARRDLFNPFSKTQVHFKLNCKAVP